MADTQLHPPIDPTNFDLIVIGTGLPESIIAAAASTAGKSVLHLDPNSHYGSHYTSLTLHDLISFLNTQSSNPNPNINPQQSVNNHTTAVDLVTRSIYSGVEICCYDESVEKDEFSRKFSLDLAGPRVLFCADLCVEMLLKSSGNQYVEFKNVDASYVCGGNGELVNVPDSKSAVFKDKTLKYSEKNQLNSFFKLVQGHLEGVRSGGNGDDGKVISEEDLERPFGVFLDKMKLAPKIKS